MKKLLLVLIIILFISGSALAQDLIVGKKSGRNFYFCRRFFVLSKGNLGG